MENMPAEEVIETFLIEESVHKNGRKFIQYIPEDEDNDHRRANINVNPPHDDGTVEAHVSGEDSNWNVLIMKQLGTFTSESDARNAARDWMNHK